MVTHHVFSVDFSPDGDMLATIGADATIHLWNPHTGRLLRTIDISPGPGLAFSPDGNILASGDGVKNVDAKFCIHTKSNFTFKTSIHIFYGVYQDCNTHLFIKRYVRSWSPSLKSGMIMSAPARIKRSRLSAFIL